MAWRSEENEHQRPWYWLGLLRIIRGRMVRLDIYWAALHSLEQRQITTVTDNSFVQQFIRDSNKENIKLRVPGALLGKPMTWWFPSQSASFSETAFMSKCHHVVVK